MHVNENLVMREIYGKCILVPARNSEAGTDPIFLNGMGRRLWELAKYGLERKEIIQIVCEEYDLEQGSAEEKAISIFIDNLLEKKIIYD